MDDRTLLECPESLWRQAVGNSLRKSLGSARVLDDSFIKGYHVLYTTNIDPKGEYLNSMEFPLGMVRNHEA
jgi:hypothetical protein